MPDLTPEDEEEFSELLEEHRKAVEEGRMQDADMLSMLMLAHAAEKMQDDPGVQLKCQAAECEMRGDWAGAEAAYRADLAQSEAEQSHWSIFKAHYDISDLYALQGRHEAAFEESQLAVEAARQADSTIVLLMALNGLASDALDLGNLDCAESCVREMLYIDEHADEPKSDLMRARALTLKARCALEQGDLTTVDADLAASRDILQPQFGMLCAAGVHGGLASWWATTARLRARRGDMAGSISAWREAVDRSRHVSTLPQLEGPYKFVSLAAQLRHLAEALRAAGHDDEAATVTAESDAIRQQFGLPPT